MFSFEDMSLATTRRGYAWVAAGQTIWTAARGAQLRRNAWFLNSVLSPKDESPRLSAALQLALCVFPNV